MSGYLVFPNNDSNTSNWARVNVVRSLRCFLGLTPETRNCLETIRQLITITIGHNEH